MVVSFPGVGRGNNGVVERKIDVIKLFHGPVKSFSKPVTPFFGAAKSFFGPVKPFFGPTKSFYKPVESFYHAGFAVRGATRKVFKAG